MPKTADHEWQSTIINSLEMRRPLQWQKLLTTNGFAPSSTFTNAGAATMPKTADHDGFTPSSTLTNAEEKGRKHERTHLHHHSHRHHLRDLKRFLEFDAPLLSRIRFIVSVLLYSFDNA